MIFALFLKKTKKTDIPTPQKNQQEILKKRFHKKPDITTPMNALGWEIHFNRKSIEIGDPLGWEIHFDRKSIEIGDHWDRKSIGMGDPLG